MKQMAVTTLVVVTFFALSNMSFVTYKLPFTGQSPREIFTLRVLFDMIGVILLQGANLMRISQLLFQETYAVETMMRTQYRQYLSAQETQELIHQKYHDLKHQLVALRAEPFVQGKEAVLESFEEEIRAFEVQVQTGNSVLDAILSEKGLLCQHNGIPFTVFAEGQVLNCLMTMDICSIFGNALDNAIEYEKTVMDTGKRFIKLDVHQKGDFVSILIENYYEGKLVPEGELPRTSKGERDYHGYGLKSIRHVANKLGGTFILRTEGEIFRLKILLPR